MKEVLRKMNSLKENELTTENVFDKNTFYENFSDYIRENSKVLKDAIIFQGKNNSVYSYDIDPVSNNIVLLGEQALMPSAKVFNRENFIPKSFGIQVSIPHRADENFILEETEKKILIQVIYQPLMAAIEKQCISGSYFNLPLFSTNNTINGSGFSGLLELARAIKQKTDTGKILIHPALIESIIDNSMPEAYKNEFLMRQTIETIPVISTIESPINFENKMCVAYDSKKIVFSLCDEISIRKIQSLDLNYHFQFFCFCNLTTYTTQA
jgi:hypothetical protein